MIGNELFLCIYLCVCVWLGDSGSWNVDVRMAIRPSSSTGVLFALVSNNSVPLSVAVVTQGEEDAVRSCAVKEHIWNFACRNKTNKHNLNTLKPFIVVTVCGPELASFLGWGFCGNAGLIDVVLPRPVNGAAECNSNRDPNLSQLIRCYLHAV